METKETTAATFPAITGELIRDLKAKHGDRLHRVTVEADDSKLIDFILKKPGRSVFEVIQRHKDDAAKVNQVLIKNCVLAGDADAFEYDGDVYGAVMAELAGLMKRKKATIKKL